MKGRSNSMRKYGNSIYILQVSDFHISEESQKSAEEALNAVTSRLKEMNISISYLVHTGDIINSKDIKAKIEQEHGTELKDEEYDDFLDKIVLDRLTIAETIMNNFIKDLDVLQKNIVICCGNHDKVRYRSKKKNAFSLFENFLKHVCNHKELTALHKLDDLNVLVLNTNISDDKRVTCIDCENLKKVLNPEFQVEDQKTWFYTYGKNPNTSLEDYKVNVIVAHQPLYDICEHIRLPYGSETQTTDFLSALQDFINGNGIYLCGDKHTSSIAASFIHDIPHYFCGHPFLFEENNFPSDCVNKRSSQSSDTEVDYNLIEIREGKTGQVRKLHLIKRQGKPWKCQIHPIDAVVSELYETSKNYIAKNSFTLLETQSGIRYSSWVNLSWRNLFNRLNTGINSDNLKEISNFYSLFCRLKNESDETVKWDDKTNIFWELCKIVTKMMLDNDHSYVQNLINIRGDYSSGKSTFLGLFYIYLLYQYNYGKINYIPAYFNIENDDILKRIQDGSTYSSAVKETFSSFVHRIENIARIEHTTVCYIIDGLDEQDIWSESSQASIGRVVLDILAETNNSKYIMAFCQNRLARFKNTMSAMKYYEKSYVMYFNSVSVKEKGLSNSSFVKFVRYIIPSNQKEGNGQGESYNSFKNNDTLDEPKECSAIRKLRRLSINSGFIYHNYQYLKEYKENDSINSIYMKYIDQQYQICLDTLGYNFIHYAPAMAYLFTYEGYTYERFKAMSPGTSIYWEQKILEYSNKIYNTFIFIKKHKDAREYLLALHYNRELRYFAENPKSEISENSIINRLIPRNISIIIKKLWRNDQNKFVIVCHNLIEKRRLSNSKPISNCTLSMLTYILAYLNRIPDYIRDEIKGLLHELSKAENQASKKLNPSGVDPWIIDGNNSERMKKFIDLNFLHSEKILNAINTNTSVLLVKELLESPNFVLYNRQYMMWYYGDLTIYGENRINNLVPGEDIINKGIDYYNSFYTLYHKLYAYFESGCTYSYPLLEFDLFTIFDLAYSRQLNKYSISRDRFFYSDDEKEKEVYIRIKDLLEKYINKYDTKNTSNKKDENVNENEFDEKIQNTVKDSTGSPKGPFEGIIEHLKTLNIETDERYVYCFFKVAKQLFPEIQ